MTPELSHSLLLTLNIFKVNDVVEPSIQENHLRKIQFPSSVASLSSEQIDVTGPQIMSPTHSAIQSNWLSLHKHKRDNFPPQLFKQKMCYSAFLPVFKIWQEYLKTRGILWFKRITNQKRGAQLGCKLEKSSFYYYNSISFLLVSSCIFFFH